MRSRIVVLAAMALIVSAAIPAVSGAAPKPKKLSPEILAQLQDPTFSDAGDVSGVLEGTVVVNGTAYTLARNVRIYQIGTGYLPEGTSVGSRRATLLGVERNGSRLVTRIMLRPAEDILAIRAAADRDGKVADENRPR